MKQFQLLNENFIFVLNMSALQRLDQLRPGMDMANLKELTETTAGLLDLSQAMTGEDREKLASLLIRQITVLPALRTALLQEVTEGLRIETVKADSGAEIDVALEELMENEIDGRLTYRRLIFMGLLSGLSFDEMGPMAPGLVCDLYTYRMRYDDEQHGIKRKKREIYD